MCIGNLGDRNGNRSINDLEGKINGVGGGIRKSNVRFADPASDIRRNLAITFGGRLVFLTNIRLISPTAKFLLLRWAFVKIDLETTQRGDATQGGCGPFVYIGFNRGSA